jgi:hypothetical protein
MGITANSGPFISYGITQNTSVSGTAVAGLTGTAMEYNEERAPSLFDLGTAMEDPRTFYSWTPGGGAGLTSAGYNTPRTWGHYFNKAYVDYVPTAVTTNAFVGSSISSTGVTSFTLTAASSLGTFATTIVAPETGQTVSVIGIGSSAAMWVSFGSAGTVAMWQPGGGTGRCISITTSSSGDLGTWSIAGRDMYGYKVTENIALIQGTTNSSGYTINSQKAFRYISAISNTSTPVSTGISIGISDTYGMPMYVPYCGIEASCRLLASAFSSAAAVAFSSANFILGSTAVTATATTADPRGTYASTTASNGTLRIQLSVTPAASAAAAITPLNVAPFYGLTQYSSV